MSKTWSRYSLRTVIGLCLVLLSAAMLYGSWWYKQGGRILSVQTGSMRPVFAPGDGIIVRPIRPTDIVIGDIISYKNAQNPGVIVSHRVIHVNQATQSVTTQGDRLLYPDPTVQPWQLVGRVTKVAPYYGSVATLVRRPLSLLMVVYLPTLLLVVYELMLVLRAHRQAAIYRLHT